MNKQKKIETELVRKFEAQLAGLNMRRVMMWAASNCFEPDLVEMWLREAGYTESEASALVEYYVDGFYNSSRMK